MTNRSRLTLFAGAAVALLTPAAREARAARPSAGSHDYARWMLPADDPELIRRRAEVLAISSEPLLVAEAEPAAPPKAKPQLAEPPATRPGPIEPAAPPRTVVASVEPAPARRALPVIEAPAPRQDAVQRLLANAGKSKDRESVVELADAMLDMADGMGAW